MPRYAAVDIGSNSVRYMVADADPQGRLKGFEQPIEVVAVDWR